MCSHKFRFTTGDDGIHAVRYCTRCGLTPPVEPVTALAPSTGDDGKVYAS